MILLRLLPPAWPAALIPALIAACATLPGASRGYRVEEVTPRGSYLDATLVRGSERVRFFFLGSDADCRALLQVENAVDYDSLGALGMVRGEGRSCEPVGIGSLDWWRRRRGRPEAKPLPTGTARFREVYRDEQVAIARGRFPLTGLVNWAGGHDTLAVLPRTDACRRLLARGEATIEYRVSGRFPLRLLSGAESCPVEGLIQPL